MQKLQLDIIKKLIEKNATSAEIDFLLYVSKFQNSYGEAEGIYYREVCDELGFSYQTFYDVKNSLIKKGIISAVKRNYTDYDITILNNVFVNEDDFKKGYLNTNYDVFSCSQFRSLKAGAKLLAMDLMKNNLAGGKSYHIGTNKFFDTYKKAYGFCERTLRDYLKMLRLIFSIGIKDKQYWVTLRVFAKKKQNKSEEQRYRDNTIAVATRRNKLKNIREEDRTALDSMLSRYGSEIKKLNGTFVKFSFANVVEKSLEKLNVGNEKRHTWKRMVKPNLIHRILRRELGLEVRELPFDSSELFTMA